MSYEDYHKAHQSADTDKSPRSIHHTIGQGPDEVAAGNHLSHANLGSLTGSKAGGAALDSVIAMLVKLGATDNTTP